MEDSTISKSMEIPRQGWEEAFNSMHENGDDRLLLPDVFENETLDTEVKQ